MNNELARLKDTWIHPAHPEAKIAESLMDLPLSKEQCLYDLLKRPNVRYQSLAELDMFGVAVSDPVVVEQIEIDAKYSGYIERQKIDIAKQKRSENVKIPIDLDLDIISGLSNEVKQKIKDFQPETLGMASRISGVTPAAISILLVFIKKHRNSRNK
ncbi:MAG TPA: tRNA uridine-5-carboxymethylaminomethyl(34) synthesis enzyme MnmG, partial [Thiomicrospira sp.]|nr:tRNA uridine-5-carboxymethylaminomethyl(34) synthesis enzyme MnmG [Thiomicrospira sp.]